MLCTKAPPAKAGRTEIQVHKIDDDAVNQKSKSWPLALLPYLLVPDKAGKMNAITRDTITERCGSIFYIQKRRNYLQKSDQIFQNIWFQNYEKSNQNTYFYQRPISYPLQWIQKGDLLGDCAASTQGELALGKNLLVAYMPWEGFNFEDAVLINNKVLSTYTSLHIEKYDLEISELEKITPHIPGIPKKNLLKLDKNGIVQIGSWVQEGDILVGKIIPIVSETQTLLTHEKLLYDIVGQKDLQIQERCLRVPQGSSGRIIRISYTYLKTEQNRKNSLHQPLSESSLTKLKTKVQTEPKLALAQTFIHKAKQTQPVAARSSDSPALFTERFTRIQKFCQHPPYAWTKFLGFGSLRAIRERDPFFVQNLQYSYFMRKSFRHFCQSVLLATARDTFCILNLGLWRNRTGSKDRMTVFEKMSNPRHMRSNGDLPFGAYRTRDIGRALLAKRRGKGTANPWQALGRVDKNGAKGFNIYISSYLRKNKKFVTIVFRWSYKSLVTKNNYLFLHRKAMLNRSMGQFAKEFYKTPIPWDMSLVHKGRLDPLEMQSQASLAHRRDLWQASRRDPVPWRDARRIFNKRFCFDGSIKSICPTRFIQDPSLDPPRLARQASRSLSQRFKNFISINQRNFQKIVFEKPNDPIQISKIIPRISTSVLRQSQRTFQKNQNRLRQQSQTKLLGTPSRGLSSNDDAIEPRGDGNLKNFCQNSMQFTPNLIASKMPNLNAFKKITIYIAEKREFQVGDKISGRHGNKGIISQIFSNCDMPYLVNGDTVDVLLNPLGVPSRMNVGQILECLLGFTGQIFHTKFQILCFDEIYGYEASRSFIYSKIFELCQKTRQKWLFSKRTPGKLNIFDGRNGQLFHQSVMVGSTYLMKLIHIVDEKIHARGTGPYSLITQQPLRGRAKHGGQRFGEMEVWALQGFGSAYTLQELLTVKSDDLQGRNQIMQTLLKNTPLHFGTPESLRVVLRELQCLCLDLQLSTAAFVPRIEDERRESLGEK